MARAQGLKPPVTRRPFRCLTSPQGPVTFTRTRTGGVADLGPCRHGAGGDQMQTSAVVRSPPLTRPKTNLSPFCTPPFFGPLTTPVAQGPKLRSFGARDAQASSFTSRRDAPWAPCRGQPRRKFQNRLNFYYE